jgi:hypothetical protein
MSRELSRLDADAVAAFINILTLYIVVHQLTPEIKQGFDIVVEIIGQGKTSGNTIQSNQRLAMSDNRTKSQKD